MLTLKRAHVRNAEVITLIKTAAFNKESREFGPGTDGGPPGYDSVECTIEGIESNIYYLICLDKKIIGSLWLHMIDDKQLELEDFVIHPDYQNRGYGKQSLVLMEEAHPEIRIWSLGTPRHSTKNQYLYEKMGYKRVGESDDKLLVLYEKRK
jgi:ribosomal protein S18 acetylase RimI-like enzyme